MPFQLSPGVLVTETDLTNIIPAVSTSTGATAGPFHWGPVMDPVLITSENELVSIFNKPVDTDSGSTASSFFNAANFLSYSSSLQVCRVETDEMSNAVAEPNNSVSALDFDEDDSNFYSGRLYMPDQKNQLVIDDPDSGVTATAEVSGVDSKGSITGFNVTNPGSGYDSNPIVGLYCPRTDLPTTAFNTTDNKITIAGHMFQEHDLVKYKVSNNGDGVDGLGIDDDYYIVNISGNEFQLEETIGGGVVDLGPNKGGDGQYLELKSRRYYLSEFSSIDGNTPSVLTFANNYLREGKSIKFFENGGILFNYEGSTSGPGQTIADGGVLYVQNVDEGAGTFTLSTDASGNDEVDIDGGYTPTLNAEYFEAVCGTTVGQTNSHFRAGPVDADIVETGLKIKNEDHYLTLDYTGFGMWAAKYPGSLGNSLKVLVADSSNYSGWEYEGEFDSAPGTSSYVARQDGSDDELHIIVIDEDGRFTGQEDAILEKFAYVSKASDAKRADGTNNYYKEVINNTSAYIWWLGHPEEATNWGTNAEFNPSTNYDTIIGGSLTGIAVSLSGGEDDHSPNPGNFTAAYDLFENTEQYDISLIPTGQVNATVARYVVDELCQKRKDCVAFVSPVEEDSDQMIQAPSPAEVLEKTVEFRTDTSFNVNSSYCVIDSGFKYQYDRYNDVYRWLPLNSDIAGLCARTDQTNDPWWSPGGLNRGQVKNVVKLSFNPNRSQRDELYRNGINPVVSFPGQGVVLYGDKTALDRPSAFDRINVRRLFIVLEKAIATAAKYQLFEFNDAFTRAQFKAQIEPFLRDVQGRRGIYDFRVVCDETNNTGEVIDRNEFIADIYIKPARSINFITLNFVAVRTGVAFEEIVS